MAAGPQPQQIDVDDVARRLSQLPLFMRELPDGPVEDAGAAMQLDALKSLMYGEGDAEGELRCPPISSMAVLIGLRQSGLRTSRSKVTIISDQSTSRKPSLSTLKALRRMMAQSLSHLGKACCPIERRVTWSWVRGTVCMDFGCR